MKVSEYLSKATVNKILNCLPNGAECLSIEAKGKAINRAYVNAVVIYMYKGKKYRAMMKAQFLNYRPGARSAIESTRTDTK